MRLKAGHSMMAFDPSTPDREAQTVLQVRPSQHKVPPSSKPREHIRRDRTSMLGSPAIDPLPPHPARIGKRRHQACRSSRARRPVGPTTDDADRKPREERSCGCSQTSLYNELRPHSNLGYLTPAAFAARLREQDAAACQSTGRIAAVCGAYALHPVAAPSRKGHEKAGNQVVASS